MRDLIWDDLVENARTMRRRIHGKTWLKNARTILSTVDFKPAGLTPQRICRWLDKQEKLGMIAIPMRNRASCLQGVKERFIKHGYEPQLALNPFNQLNFSVSARR